jgi:putative membrane protein
MIVTFAFLHHLAAFALVACLAVQFILIGQPLTLASARKLMAVDRVLGISAVALLIVGLSRVFYFEKGAAYYFSSHAFLAKFTLFVVAALVSAIPTIEFLKWRKDVAAGQVPQPDAKKLRVLKMAIHWELFAIVLILAFAAIMAKGGFV